MTNLITKIKKLADNQTAAIFLILLLALISYCNVFTNQFVLDDFDFIVDRPLIQDGSHWSQFFSNYVPPQGQEGIYSPLKILFHAINYHLFELKPLGYHIIALLGYFLTIIFVYRLSFIFTKNSLMALLSGLLFALHPVHIEYVTSMTGSVDAIGVLFFFMSFYFYVRSGEHNKLNFLYYYSSFVLAILAVFTHELTISLPLLMIWYDFCYSQKAFDYKKCFLKTTPFVVIVLIYALMKYTVLGTITQGSYLYDSFYLTIFVMIKAWAKYIAICFVPLVLTHNHIISQGIFSFDAQDFDKFEVLTQSIFDGQVIVSIFVIFTVGYFLFKNFKRQSLIPFLGGWFFICLLPVSNIIPSPVYFAEGYLFPGSWAFCLLIAYFLNYMLHHKAKILKVHISTLGLALLVFLVGFYSVRTLLRNKDWHNEVSLFQSAVRANPNSALMRKYLGQAYHKYQMPEKAIKSFKQSLAIRRDNPDIYLAMAKAYMQMQHFKQAVYVLNEAVKLDTAHAKAYYNLSGIYASYGRYRLAEENLNKSFFYYRKQGRVQEAQQVKKALEDYLNRLKETDGAR